MAFLLAVVEKRLAPGATILDVDVVPRLGGVALWFREERADGSVADYFIALPNLETAPAEIVAEMPVEEQAAEDDDGPDALFGGSCGFMVAAYADGRDDIVSVEPWVPRGRDPPCSATGDPVDLQGCRGPGPMRTRRGRESRPP